jgi:predicted nucleic acid-binding protein
MGVADLRSTLATHSLLCVDTMVFIYLLDANPHYVELATAVFASIEQSVVHGVTSTLTLAEVLIAPLKQGNTQAVIDYELYLTNFPNLHLQPPTNEIARMAATVRATTGLKMPDAIQVATAIVTGAGAIISNDKQWRNKVTQPALILLDDYR